MGSRFVVAAVALTGCIDVEEPETGEITQEVVYGIDNRQDVFAHPDLSLRRLARLSTVALVPTSRVNAANPNNVVIASPGTVEQVHGLCAGERFGTEPTSAICSGTLIDDDLVLTAGHCIDATSCATTSFVFDYFRISAGQMKTVISADVFTCAQVVARGTTRSSGSIARRCRASRRHRCGRDAPRSRRVSGSA